MSLVAYDFKRKIKDIASVAEYKIIDRAKETEACKALVRKGILDPELALCFRPLWRRYLQAARSSFVWCFLVGLSKRIRLWLWL